MKESEPLKINPDWELLWGVATGKIEKIIVLMNKYPDIGEIEYDDKRIVHIRFVAKLPKSAKTGKVVKL